MKNSCSWVWKEKTGEKAGLSPGLGNSQKDHLSVLTLFFFFLLCVCLAAAGAGGAAVATPMGDYSSGAVPEPAPSHLFGLDCGFLGNHPDQRKHSAPDGSY